MTKKTKATFVKCRYPLEGSRYHIVVFIDHKNLDKTTQVMDGRRVRWKLMSHLAAYVEQPIN